MNLMRSSNPSLNENIFRGLTADSSRVMTLQGTINRVFLLLALVVVSAGYTWGRFSMDNPGASTGWIWGGAIGGMIVAFITVFKKEWSPITTPIYSVFEGLFLGSLSAMFEARYPGLVIQAVALTFATLFALLFVYKTGMIKVTDNFRLGVVAATGGIALVYFLSFLLGLFGVNVAFLHNASLLSIGISIFVVIIAALNLVLDFDFIEKASASSQVPKYMEWYAAFGLIVTLIWLYIEFLRLLSKLASRD